MSIYSGNNLRNTKKIEDYLPYDNNGYIDFAKRLHITDFINENSKLEDTITILQFCTIINEMIAIKNIKVFLNITEYIAQLYNDFPNVWLKKRLNNFFCLLVYTNEKNGKIDKNIRNMLSTPYDKITISQSLLLLKIIFSFILDNEYNENVYNHIKVCGIITEPRNELNILMCYKIIYLYSAFLLKEIDNKNKDYIENLINYWDNSPIHAYSFLKSICKATPQIVNLTQNKVIIYIFNNFYKDREAIKDAYKKIIEIDNNTKLKLFNKLKLVLMKSGYQYTSLNSLYKMLSKSNKLNKFYNNATITLHMSNVEYLNDPNEGKLYRDTINNFFSKMNNEYDYKPCYDNCIQSQNTYILCLSKNKDEHLPMWVQYADGAKGCRIEFSIPRNIKMYEIEYCKSKNKLPEGIENLLQKYKEETNNIVKGYIKDKLNEIQYYYKDQYYEHEQEVRYTLNVSPQNALEYDFIREGEYFPRLYCETPYPFPIKSVMLGPKCPNPEQVALYLKRMGVPEVYKSNIKFQ